MVIAGCVSPRKPLTAVVDHLQQADQISDAAVADATHLLRHNRVVMIAAQALREYADEPVVQRMLAELKPQVERRHRRHERVAAAIDVVDETTRRLGIPAWGIKGLASRLHYPDPSLRELRDVDIAVPDEEMAFLLARALRERGYATARNELPWLKADRHGAIYGQYKLVGPGALADVDIHFGPGYSTGHCGLLPVPPPTAPGLTPLPAVENLRPMVGNSGGDIHITMKDINDLWVVARSLTPDEASGVITDARRAGLAGHLAGIARLTLAATAVGDGQEAVLRRMADAGGKRAFRPMPASGFIRESRARVWRTTVRAYQQAKAHTKSPLTPVAVAMSAAAYYSVPLRLRTRRLPVAARPVPRPWRCVRLVPASLAQCLDRRGTEPSAWKGDAVPQPSATATPAPTASTTAPYLRWQRLGAGHVVQAGDAVFVPTVWYAPPSRLIRQAAAYQQQVTQGTDESA